MRALAGFGQTWAHNLIDVNSDPAVLDTTGRWAVVIPYTGTPTFLRFATWTSAVPDDAPAASDWHGPATSTWTTSLGRTDYIDAVETTREAIAAGTVYQANICRVLSAPIDAGVDVAALSMRLASSNPAPYAGFIRAPEAGINVATASPELFIGRDGDRIESGPIKGTAPTAAGLTDKDRAENVMIVDLVRNDLSRVCAPGTVHVPSLLAVEEHPGLVHLVSTVAGTLAPGVTWPGILDATFPPGSITGAPKSSALRIIDELECAPREVYCGTVGWVDADARTARLAVAIRTFWVSDGHLRFGTGAGITWGSDAAAEWEETELKARRLVGLASS